MSFKQPAPASLRTRDTALGDLISALHGRIVAAIVLRRATRALHSLDDYMLKDLGLSRADIERISEGEDVGRLR